MGCFTPYDGGQTLKLSDMFEQNPLAVAMFSSQTCEKFHRASLLAGGCKQRAKHDVSGAVLGPLSVS